MTDRSIEIMPTDDPRLHAFRINGRIGKADIDWMAGHLKRAFEDQQQIDVLIVMKRYQGIDAGAVFSSEALSAQASANRHVRRYAVVGAPGWAEAMINLFSPLTPVDARTFEVEEELAAWQWVGSR